jgi:hypothetical protein
MPVKRNLPRHGQLIRLVFKLTSWRRQAWQWWLAPTGLNIPHYVGHFGAPLAIEEPDGVFSDDFCLTFHSWILTALSAAPAVTWLVAQPNLSAL